MDIFRTCPQFAWALFPVSHMNAILGASKADLNVDLDHHLYLPNVDGGVAFAFQLL